MKKKMQELAKLIKEKVAGANALLGQTDVTEEDRTKADSFLAEAESLKAQYDTMEKASSMDAWLEEGGTDAPQVDAKTEAPAGGGVHIEGRRKHSHVDTSGLKAFQGEGAAEKAERFGHWFLGMLGQDSARKWCVDNGVVEKMSAFANARTKALSENTNASGGALVPVEFRAELIRLVRNYGVIRKYAQVVPMATDSLIMPRRTGGITVYYPGEAGSITASNPTYDNIELTARKYAALTRIPSELNEDSAIDIGDQVMAEMAYAFAKAEDDNGFVGDGTSTYAGTVGITTKLKSLSGTIADIAGLFVGTGNAYSELVLTDFEGVVAKLPDYADNESTRWVMNRAFYYSTPFKLALAAGGVPAYEIFEGQRKPVFLGYPVEWANSMPKTEANSQVCALLGDFSKGVMLGDRRMYELATSEHESFTTDQITLRATCREDINVHDVGNASSSAGSREEGPIVGLITAAS